MGEGWRRAVEATRATQPHVHKEATACRCYLLADEPSDKCPQHGSAQPVCRDCGQFMRYQDQHTDAEER